MYIATSSCNFIGDNDCLSSLVFSLDTKVAVKEEAKVSKELFIVISVKPLYFMPFISKNILFAIT